MCGLEKKIETISEVPRHISKGKAKKMGGPPEGGQVTP